MTEVNKIFITNIGLKPIGDLHHHNQLKHLVNGIDIKKENIIILSDSIVDIKANDILDLLYSFALNNYLFDTIHGFDNAIREALKVIKIKTSQPELQHKINFIINFMQNQNNYNFIDIELPENIKTLTGKRDAIRIYKKYVKPYYKNDMYNLIIFNYRIQIVSIKFIKYLTKKLVKKHKLNEFNIINNKNFKLIGYSKTITEQIHDALTF